MAATIEDDIRRAAEEERHTLLMQAARQHANNITTEVARFERELKQIERTYRLRTGEES